MPVVKEIGCACRDFAGRYHSFLNTGKSPVGCLFHWRLMKSVPEQVFSVWGLKGKENVDLRGL